MKRLALSIFVILFGVNLALAQERHYSYRYAGTAYKAKGGGTTTMTDKSSSCKLPSNFTASFLPDHKTVWLYGSGINEKLTGSGKLSSGGYDFSSGADFYEIMGAMVGESVPTSSYTLFAPSDYSKIIVTSLETDSPNSEYYTTRFDYYNRVATVSAPHNSKRIEAERKEAEQKVRSEQYQRESAEREAKEKAARDAHDRALKNSIGKPFPMAYFVDSHGKRVSSSYFQRSKKTLVITYMPGCKPNLLLKELLKGYPEIASQIINIYLVDKRYSERKYDTSAPVRTDRIYYNPSESNNSNWIYRGSCPCIILLDESGNVISYKFGYNRTEDMGYMMNIINQLRGRSGNGAPYQIGDYYYDGKTEGIVFEVWDNGYSGKIVSLKHSENIKRWGVNSINYSETFGVKDGKNMMAVVDAYNIYCDAFEWCRSLGWQWYLPTIDELQVIYKNKAIIEPKLTHRLERYWSCTEQSAEKAYCIEEGSGTVFASEKHYGCRIRAVATFGKSQKLSTAKTSAPYKVGDYYNENGKHGVVFEVDAEGTSGKIVSLYYISAKSAWDKNKDSGAIGAYSMTDGRENTDIVKQFDNWKSRFTAFERCVSYGNGWYLPSKEELLTIAENKGLINKNVVDILIHKYWSSSEVITVSKLNDIEIIETESDAITVDMVTGKSSTSSKQKEHYVRAVAAFGNSTNKPHQPSNQKTTAPYKTGDYYNDGVREGVVFEVWDGGNSGKIVSMQRGLTYCGAHNSASNNEFDGAKNREVIMQNEGWKEQYPAHKWCAELGEGWYIPSIRELTQIMIDSDLSATINKTLKAKGADLLDRSGQEQEFYISSYHLNKEILLGVTKKKGAWHIARLNNYHRYYIRAVATFGTTPRPTTTLIRPKTSAPYNVGDYYNDGVKDGIVFEATAGGFQGKIVSINESMGKLCWAKDCNTYCGAKSKTDGAYNMKVIKSATNNLEDYPAFKWCADLGEGWYLPSVKELQAIYKCRKIVNKNTSHWSSTESKKVDKYYQEYRFDYDRIFGAFAVDMCDGNNIASPQDWSNTVRAVAKF